MYKLNFFVPVEDKERVKNALFKMGVGKYDNYECFRAPLIIGDTHNISSFFLG